MMIQRKLIAPFLLSIFFISVACSNEPLTEDPVTATPTEPTQKEPVQTNGETPCDFALTNLEANSTVIIDCMMDLGGQTINIPAGVTIEYQAGGDIINGTLNFSDGAVISGEFLNASLKITGSTPALKDPTFNFIPSRWGIIEGQTTSEIALENNKILEDVMFKIKGMGGTTFKIGAMDAYFEVNKVTSTTSNQNFYPQKEAINIPSDFNLIMSDNTILRVFPTVGPSMACLIGIDNISNSTIKGGILYGDRDIRQYTESNKGNGTLLIIVKSGKNITIDGVKLEMSSRAGVTINSYGFAFNDDYDPTHNVIIKNCVFEKTREMGLSITDGYNIEVDNNTFKDVAQPTSNSDGGVVGYAINIEPIRERNATTGELIPYQLVNNVTIKNNKESGSRQGSFGIYIGDSIIIENNNIESSVSYGYASNCEIRNNIFEASNNPQKPAIIAGGAGDTVFNNKVFGNSITGYGVGISATFRDIDVYDNKILNCDTGIQLKESSDMKIHHNSIVNKVKSSRGITAHIANINNIDIYNNEIDVMTNPLYFVQLNQLDYSQNYSLNVFDNNFVSSGKVTLSNAQGVTFSNNTTNGGVELSNSNNINLTGNTISTTDSNGINLLNQNFNINLNSNIITYPTTGNYQCIKISDTTSSSEISNLETNTCN